MRISSRAEYAIAAVMYLALHDAAEAASAKEIAEDTDIPFHFLEVILSELRKAGLVRSRRGVTGGYVLEQPAAEISLGDVIRAVDGPLVFVGEKRPSDLRGGETSEELITVWVALRASVRNVLDITTIGDVISGRLPAEVTALTQQPGAWQNG